MDKINKGLYLSCGMIIFGIIVFIGLMSSYIFGIIGVITILLGIFNIFLFVNLHNDEVIAGRRKPYSDEIDEETVEQPKEDVILEPESIVDDVDEEELVDVTNEDEDEDVKII